MEPARTDQARRVMEHASQESARLQHAPSGTEQLLLGIIAEGTGPAVPLMMGMGINLRILRECLEDYIADGVGGDASGERAFTQAARRAVEGAVEEARSMRKDHVRAEHLLIALQKDKNSAGGFTDNRILLRLLDRELDRRSR